MSFPNFHGNWVDLLILAFLFFYAWEGFERGFLILLGEMGSFVVAFIVALRFYPQAAIFLETNFSISLEFAKALGFILTAVGVEMVLGIFLGVIYKRLPPSWFTLRWNKILGVIPAVVDGLILVGFLATALVSLPVSGAVKHAILTSRIASTLVSQARGFERTLDDAFGGVIQQTLSFLTVNPQSQEKIDLHFTTNQTTVDAAGENEMLNLVNGERMKRGIASLVADEKLRAVARAHSQDMFVRGYFSHIDPDGNDPFARMRAAGISFEEAGENIAYAPSVSIAHEGLMNSPEHKANILNPDFHKVGIGIIDGGVYGIMVTQDFTN